MIGPLFWRLAFWAIVLGLAFLRPGLPEFAVAHDLKCWPVRKVLGDMHRRHHETPTLFGVMPETGAPVIVFADPGGSTFTVFFARADGWLCPVLHGVDLTLLRPLERRRRPACHNPHCRES